MLWALAKLVLLNMGFDPQAQNKVTCMTFTLLVHTLAFASAGSGCEPSLGWS